MNLDALVRSASLIFLFHQRFLLLESVYFLISVSFYFIQKVGAPCPPPPTPQPLPLRGPWLHKSFLAHALKSSIHDHFISFYFIQKVGAPGPPPPTLQPLPLCGPWLHKSFLAHALKSSIHDH